MPARLSIQGVNETRQYLEDVARALHGNDAVNKMYRAGNLIMRDTKKYSPVDTGRLRNSITTQVRSVGLSNRLQGVVGTNVKYAPFMEKGTKHNRMPPISALEGWARRHNTNAYLVAKAILRNGGLKGHFMFQKSYDKNLAEVNRILSSIVWDAIERN